MFPWNLKEKMLTSTNIIQYNDELNSFSNYGKQKIDETVRNQWEEQAEKEEGQRRKNVDFEPKLGGFSLKNTSPFVKSLYLMAVSAGIIGIFFFGMISFIEFIE